MTALYFISQFNKQGTVILDHDFIQYLVNCKFVKLIIIVPNDRFHHEKGTYEIENKKEKQKGTLK